MTGWSSTLFERRRWLVAAATACAFGILGMHALNLHGTTASGTSANSMPATVVSSVSRAATVMAVAPSISGGHAAHEPAGGEHASGTSSSTERGDGGSTSPHPPGHDTGDTMMLCVAILAAAASALLLAHVLRGVPRTHWLTARTAFRSILTGLTPAPTGTGPPPVWEFSVIRC